MTEGVIFTLHLETHGSEKGIHLSSGECVPWKLFMDNIRSINIKMCNLLVVNMAMCKGGAILTHIEPEKRAPYLAFIASYRDLTVDEIARGFSAFYNEYSSPLDLSKGMNALTTEIDGNIDGTRTFWILTSEEVFNSTFNPDRDPKHFKLMVEEQYANRVRKGDKNISFEIVENDIRKMFEEVSAKHKDYYCFKDILN